jgi:hypothetical protein
VASRASAGPGDVLVSGTVRDLAVGAGFDLVHRCRTRFDNVPGEWEILWVRSSSATENQ